MALLRDAVGVLVRANHQMRRAMWSLVQQRREEPGAQGRHGSEQRDRIVLIEVLCKSRQTVSVFKIDFEAG